MFVELRELLRSGAIRRHQLEATKNTAPNGIAEYRQKAVS